MTVKVLLDKHVYPKLDEAVMVFVTVRTVPVPVWRELRTPQNLSLR